MTCYKFSKTLKIIMPRKKIKILSPIDRLEEALPLIEAGADEFYCGVILGGKNLSCIRTGTKNGCPKDYLSRSNLPDLDELKKLVRLMKDNKRKIFLALNFTFLNDNKINTIESEIGKIKKTGIDGIIVSDLRLLDILQKAKIKAIASSFLEAKNKETIKYLIGLGFERIIFDRQITTEDLKITRSYPEKEFETFVMYGGCRSLAGYCNPALLSVNRRLLKNKSASVHLCFGSYIAKENRILTKTPVSFDRDVMAKRLTMPKPTCGGCAIYQFKKCGIDSLKIVGRGFETEEKVAAVKFVRSCLELANICKDEKRYYNRVRKIYKDTFNESCKRNCYYPHFLK